MENFKTLLRPPKTLNRHQFVHKSKVPKKTVSNKPGMYGRPTKTGIAK